MATASHAHGPRGTGRESLEGGGGVPLPRVTSVWPAAVSLTASARFHGIGNRQQPPLTTSATSFNRRPNRFWDPFGGRCPSNAPHGTVV